MDAYLPLTNGEKTLTASAGNVLGETALGYGKTIELHVTTVVPEGAHGGWWLAIGSYAVHFRSGSARTWTTTNGTSFKETSPRNEYVLDLSVFKTGATVYYCVDLIDATTARATVTVVDSQGKKQTFSHDFTRISGEIADADAKVSVAIRTDGQVDSLTIKTVD